MKSGIIYIFKMDDYIDPLLGVSFVKEKFRFGEFYNETWINLALRQDMAERYDAPYHEIKKNLLAKSNMDEFHQNNQLYFKKVREVNSSHKLNLSWLEILQLTAISVHYKNMDENFILEKAKELFSFYQKIIKVYNF